MLTGRKYVASFGNMRSGLVINRYASNENTVNEKMKIRSSGGGRELILKTGRLGLGIDKPLQGASDELY